MNNISKLVVAGGALSISVFATVLLIDKKTAPTDIIDKKSDVVELERVLEERGNRIAELEQEVSDLLENRITQTTVDTVDMAASLAGQVPEHPTGTHVEHSEGDIPADQITFDEATAEVHSLLVQIDAMATDAIEYDVETQEQVNNELTEMMTTDPLAVEEVLGLYLLDPNSKTGQTLAAILGEFRDEQIESAAINLASQGNEPDDRIAGLSLLQRLGIENERTRNLTLDIIATETNPELVNTALYTLQHQILSPEQNREVLYSLASRLTDANPETRRRSIIAYSDWARNSQALEPIISALTDSSIDVRAGAAFALGKAQAQSSTIRDALVARVADEEEDWTVRDQAWIALERFELNEVSHQVYADFKILRDLHGEVLTTE